MCDAASDPDHDRNRERLQQLKNYFEEKEQRVLSGDEWSENADKDEILFDEYMTLHFRYGERGPPRESGLVAFYRKLLRLPEETGE